MSITPSDVRGWKPAKLSDSASAFERVKEDLETILSNLATSAGNAQESWTGVGSDAAYSRAMSEKEVGEELSERIGDVIDELRDGHSALSSARQFVVGKLDAAERESFRVSDAWEVADTSASSLTSEEKAKRDLRLQEHKEDIFEARRQLIEEDTRVSNQIDGAIDELVASAVDASEGRFFEPPDASSLSDSELSKLVGDPRFQEWVAEHPDAAKEYLDPLFDQGRLNGNAESTFYEEFLRNYWAHEAMEAAGIDPKDWDTSAGTGKNAENIQAVYDYYAQLYLNNPDFQWAGMANMIGPSFAGGFYDLKGMRELARSDKLPDRLKPFADLTDRELAFYEQKFLGMQKEIFTDQAGQHEAFLAGGTQEIDRLKRAGVVDSATGKAWDRMEWGMDNKNSTDPATASRAQGQIDKANKQLLYREQMDIIADDYDEMRNRPVSGQVVTYGLSTVGQPSIPGAESLTVHDPLYLNGGPVQARVPEGNIANEDTRWDLIENDTLPAYQDLIRNDPERAREIIGSDFSERMDDQRLLNRLGPLADDLVWHGGEPR